MENSFQVVQINASVERYLLCGWHQECGHLDLPACPVHQLRSRHEVLCLAACARSAEESAITSELYQQSLHIPMGKTADTILEAWPVDIACSALFAGARLRHSLTNTIIEKCQMGLTQCARTDPIQWRICSSSPNVYSVNLHVSAVSGIFPVVWRVRRCHQGLNLGHVKAVLLNVASTVVSKLRFKGLICSL